MYVQSLIKMTKGLGIDFYAGVPDSQLNALCHYLQDTYGPVSQKHVVAANEGGAVGLAAGHYLATGTPALVYMQNSGLGNAINPICSLLSDRVYAIPALFVIGWRGEPGIKDEPQHVFQGEITLHLLDCLRIPYTVLDQDSDEQTLLSVSEQCRQQFAKGCSYALVVRKNALTYEHEKETQTQTNTASNASFINDSSEDAAKTAAASASASNTSCSLDTDLSREQALALLAGAAHDQTVLVGTTGKLSRELYEIREQNGQSHERDFLTVGSMGHALMIAQGIAAAKESVTVWCLDGDGAMLMHMGGVALTGLKQSRNLVHFVINNGAHESVGGMPTAAASKVVSLAEIARACGYQQVFEIHSQTALKQLLARDRLNQMSGPVFIEIKTNTRVRKDLGRPTTTPIENKEAFMRYLEALK